ncbi:von Willebrand factor type A domain protein YehP [Escherichia coli]|uniref:von Willebrand factor type A domain protein YehP n=1 Tax=Escherichia coli TaxID=562 RepID=A0A377B8D6_ECOLX|nr:von Willebrand factor type A domain protein YehP [Escherichia coli]
MSAIAVAVHLFHWRGNFDFKSTLRANLQHWHPQHGKLYIESPRFNSRIKRQSEQWQLVLLVDQSGSMVDSVIHSAVMAACLWQLPGIRTHLVAFDTSVVDLTADVADPVELLMKVQLGGGTNIASAVEYGRQLIEQPAKSVIILVSDFYEGGSSSLLTHQVKKCVQSGNPKCWDWQRSIAPQHLAMTAIRPRRWLMSAHK